MKRTRSLFIKSIAMILLFSLFVTGTFIMNVSAAYVEYAYSGSDSNGIWKASEFNDTATGNQFLYVYSDCWKETSGIRYHEHIMMTKGTTAISRLTVTVQPMLYSTGAYIGTQRRYDAYNATRLRVLPQSIDSSGQLVTVYSTLEAQHTTATYTYHNFFGI